MKLRTGKSLGRCLVSSLEPSRMILSPIFSALSNSIPVSVMALPNLFWIQEICSSNSSAVTLCLQRVFQGFVLAFSHLIEITIWQVCKSQSYTVNLVSISRTNTSAGSSDFLVKAIDVSMVWQNNMCAIRDEYRFPAGLFLLLEPNLSSLSSTRGRLPFHLQVLIRILLG